jgi:hypothetical protein
MPTTGQLLKNAVDSLKNNQAGYANTKGVGLDLQYGGLNGILPNIAKVEGGVVYGNWISNTPDTTGMVQAVLLDYPKFFDMAGSDASKSLRGKLANFISSHSETIEGVNDTFNWEFDDSSKVGRTGESIHIVSNATLTPTEVTISCTEKLGLPIRDLFTFIGRYGIMDVYSGSALAHLLPNYTPGAWTLDKQSFSILVYELDSTGTVVKNAQIVANMMARTSGEYTMKKDINGAKEVRKYSIGFTGFGIRGLEVIQVAQTYVNEVTKSTKDALLTKALYQGPVDNVGSNVINGTLKATAGNL